MHVHKLFFKASSNETRLKIIQLLKNRSLSVGEISQELDFEQSRVSHNLRCLEDCGFVNVEVKGNYRIYSLDKETILPILELFDAHIKKYEKKLFCCAVLGEK